MAEKCVKAIQVQINHGTDVRYHTPGIPKGNFKWQSALARQNRCDSELFNHLIPCQSRLNIVGGTEARCKD